MIPNFFPVECSILSSDALCERILPNYALNGERHCRLLQHGDNDTYVVSHEQDRYILRVWSNDTRPRAEIEAEVELLDLLAQQRVLVAQPLKHNDGSYLSTVFAPEGQRFIGLFRYMPGEPPGRQITQAQAYAYGCAVAAMHQAFDTVTQIYPRPSLTIQRLLDMPLAAILPQLTHRPADAAYLTQLAEMLTARIADLPITPPLYGLCHGDLHKNNLLWAADQQLTLLDFDLCGYGWRAYDLAVLFWSTRYLPQARAVREAYLQGYCTKRALQPEEMQALPYFVAVRDMYITATELSQALRGVAGSAAITDAFFDEHVAFLRQWMDAVKNDTYYTL